MKIETTRFGEVEIKEDKPFTFIEQIIGFDKAKSFVLIENDEDSVFRWLQSTEYKDLAFPTTIPANFGIEYIFEIDDVTADKLELKSEDDLITFNIVSIPQGMPQKSTINLVAPILINKTTKNGLQYIISNSQYSAKHFLFSQNNEEV